MRREARHATRCLANLEQQTERLSLVQARMARTSGNANARTSGVARKQSNGPPAERPRRMVHARFSGQRYTDAQTRNDGSSVSYHNKLRPHEAFSMTFSYINAMRLDGCRYGNTIAEKRATQ
eukprot:9432831-Pyramimonas_sp.AAC.2